MSCPSTHPHVASLCCGRETQRLWQTTSSDWDRRRPGAAESGPDWLQEMLFKRRFETGKNMEKNKILTGSVSVSLAMDSGIHIQPISTLFPGQTTSEYLKHSSHTHIPPAISPVRQLNTQELRLRAVKETHKSSCAPGVNSP